MAKPKFFQLIDNAITQDSLSLIQELYELEGAGVIDENLNIVWNGDLEVMEKTVRFLVKCDILFGNLNAKILVRDVPTDKVDEVIWFVKLFSFLESEISNWEISESDLVYLPNKNHFEAFDDPRMELNFNVQDMKFLYKNCEVLLQ